jgi:hypothetical protein
MSLTGHGDAAGMEASEGADTHSEKSNGSRGTTGLNSRLGEFRDEGVGLFVGGRRLDAGTSGEGERANSAMRNSQDTSERRKPTLGLRRARNEEKVNQHG